MVKIALDAGHGLKTAGKQTPNGEKEWLLNDKVRDKVEAILKDYECEIINVDNNEGNVDETLANRLNRYLNAGVSAFVSIHHNAFTGRWNTANGVEVYVDKNATVADKCIANLVYGKMVKYTGLRGRGVKHANFAVINQNKVPAILCEGGFMDGTNDYKIITSEAGQTAYAKAVAEGLIEFLNLNKKAVSEKLTGTAVKEVYKTNEPSKANCFERYKGGSGSIVTALKTIGENSAFTYRKKIAKANGISFYVGSAKQNITMLTLLKSGTLIKPQN